MGNAKLEGDVRCAGYSSEVTAVVAFNPVLDLTGMPHRENVVESLLGGTCESKLDLCREASPMEYAGKQSAPILILHGTADETVPYAQATAMASKLQAAGVKVKLFTAPGGPHTFWSQPQWYKPWERAVVEFLGPWLDTTP
jgi:dipeptidyl aminopeptidase/acylaminoacyl peptidase